MPWVVPDLPWVVPDLPCVVPDFPWVVPDLPWVVPDLPWVVPDFPLVVPAVPPVVPDVPVVAPDLLLTRTEFFALLKALTHCPTEENLPELGMVTAARILLRVLDVVLLRKLVVVEGATPLSVPPLLFTSEVHRLVYSALLWPWLVIVATQAP